MTDDTISRQAAIEALGEEPLVWHEDDAGEVAERNQWRRDVAAIKALPSVQPTLYGYNIKILSFIAAIMAEEGLRPEEAVRSFKDIGCMAEILSNSMKKQIERAVGEWMT